MTGGIINRINVRVAIVVTGVAIAVGAIAPINSSADNHECADFDGNGRVGAVDLAAVATSYGQPSEGEVFGVSHMLQVMQQNGASCVAP